MNKYKATNPPFFLLPYLIEIMLAKAAKINEIKFS
jgi:hypothetical protein